MKKEKSLASNPIVIFLTISTILVLGVFGGWKTQYQDKKLMNQGTLISQLNIPTPATVKTNNNEKIEKKEEMAVENTNNSIEKTDKIIEGVTKNNEPTPSTTATEATTATSTKKVNKKPKIEALPDFDISESQTKGETTNDAKRRVEMQQKVVSWNDKKFKMYKQLNALEQRLPKGESQILIELKALQTKRYKLGRKLFKIIKLDVKGEPMYDANKEIMLRENLSVQQIEKRFWPLHHQLVALQKEIDALTLKLLNDQ